MKLKVDFNGEAELDIEAKDGVLELNGEGVNYDLSKKSDGEYILIKNRRVYNITVLEQAGDILKLSINGQTVDLTLKDHVAQILEELGMDMAIEDNINEIAAPMPGAIIEVNVSEGQEIEEGNTLLILEAMKMENIIKSPINGRIQKIHVSTGQNVDKNQVLISF